MICTMTDTPQGSTKGEVTSMNQVLARGVKTYLKQTDTELQALAAALGLTRWTVYRRLQGKTPWTDSEIEQLATFMKTTVPKMLTWMYKPPRP